MKDSYKLQSKQFCDFGLDGFGRTVAHAGNMGLNEMAGEVLNEKVVHLINLGAERKCCASKPPLR